MIVSLTISLPPTQNSWLRYIETRQSLSQQQQSIAMGYKQKLNKFNRNQHTCTFVSGGHDLIFGDFLQAIITRSTAHVQLLLELQSAVDLSLILFRTGKSLDKYHRAENTDDASGYESVLIAVSERREDCGILLVRSRLASPHP